MLKKNAFVGILACLMALVLSGCGTPRAEKLADRVFSVEFNSVGGQVFIESEINTVINDINANIKLDNMYAFSLEANSESENGEFLASMSTKKSSDLPDEINKNDDCSYYYKDGVFYADRDDALYQTVDEGMREKISQDTINKLKLGIVNILYKASVNKETKMYGDEECYIMEYTLKGNELYNYLMDVATVIGAEDKLQNVFTSLNINNEVSAYEFLSYFPIKVKAAVTVQSGYLAGLDFDMSEIDLDNAAKFLGTDVSNLFSELGINISSADISDLYLGMNFFEYDNTTVVFPEGIDNALEYDNKDFYELMFPVLGVSKDYITDNYSGENDETVAGNEADFGSPSEDLAVANQNADDDLVVTLFDSNGNSVCDVNVPDGLQYYKVYSEDTSINLMNTEGTIDCYISSDSQKGYGGEYLKEYLQNGSYSENFDVIDNEYNFGNVTGKIINEKESDKIYIVCEVNSSEIFISFSTGINDEVFEQEVKNMINEMFN